MSLTLGYVEATLDAVTIAVTGLPAPALGAVTGIVQASPDGGLSWRTVRGLAEAQLTAGTLTAYPRADWEFRPGVEHTYRAGVNQHVDTFTRTVSSGWGTSDTGEVWSGGVFSDLSVSTGKGRVLHTAANLTYTISQNAATTIGDVRAEATISVSQVATGAVFYDAIILRSSGGGANFYRAKCQWGLSGVVTLIVDKFVAGVLTNLATVVLTDTYSAAEAFRLVFETNGQTIRAKLYQAADPEPATWTATVSDTSLSSGLVAIASRRELANTNVAASSVWDDWVMLVDEDPVFLGGTFTQTITPTTGVIYVKSTTRPFLNFKSGRDGLVIAYQSGARDARTAVDSINGRTAPIARTELMSSKAIQLDLYARTTAERDGIDYLVASGDILFVQTPLGCPLPSGYYRVDSSAPGRFRPRGESVRFPLPMLQVAAPGPDVAAALATWDSYIATWGTWDNVIATGMDWDQILLAAVGTPAEVIVD